MTHDDVKLDQKAMDITSHPSPPTFVHETFSLRRSEDRGGMYVRPSMEFHHFKLGFDERQGNLQININKSRFFVRSLHGHSNDQLKITSRGHERYGSGYSSVKAETVSIIAARTVIE
jgi:hypothetical protein